MLCPGGNTTSGASEAIPGGPLTSDRNQEIAFSCNNCGGSLTPVAVVMVMVHCRPQD